MLSVKPASKSSIAGKNNQNLPASFTVYCRYYIIINQNILTLKSAEKRRCEVASGVGGREGGVTPTNRYSQRLLCDFASLGISIRRTNMDKRSGVVAKPREDVTTLPSPIDISRKAVGSDC